MQRKLKIGFIFSFANARYEDTAAIFGFYKVMHTVCSGKELVRGWSSLEMVSQPGQF